MIDKIKHILSDYSGVSAAAMSEKTELVSDLGLSSLDVVNIIVAFEDEFGVEVPDSDIKNLRTVEDIVKYLSNYLQCDKR